MGEKVKDLRDMRYKNKFVKRNNSKHTPANGIIYYRDTLKIFVKQHYNIKNYLLDIMCVDLLPKSTKTYMFGIEYTDNNIYLYTSGKKINVSEYIDYLTKTYKF